MYVADVMRYRATHRVWTLPAFGEVVAVANPGPKKAFDPRGQLEKPDDSIPTIQQWLTVEDPDG
eukprot:352945-Prorocentrum_lima.AAC.1